MFDHTLSNAEARELCPMSKYQMRNMMRAYGFQMQGGWYISAVKLQALIASGVAETFINGPEEIEPVSAEEWRKCDEKPPRISGEYLVYTESGNMKKARFSKKRGFLIKEMVTHWLPLPLPPAKED